MRDIEITFKGLVPVGSQIKKKDAQELNWEWTLQDSLMNKIYLIK